MNKKWIALLLLVLLLAACNPDNTQPSNPTPGVSGGQGVWDNSKWNEATWQ